MEEEEFAKLPVGTLFQARRLERDWKDYEKRIPGKWYIYMKVNRPELAVDSEGRLTLSCDLVEGSVTVLFTPSNDFSVESCVNREHHGTTFSVCSWCGYDPLEVE